MLFVSSRLARVTSLNKDGTEDLNALVARRHAKRLVEVGNIFKGVYGDAAINESVRVVYAWWTVFPDQYAAVLNWVKSPSAKPPIWRCSSSTNCVSQDTAIRSRPWFCAVHIALIG